MYLLKQAAKRILETVGFKLIRIPKQGNYHFVPDIYGRSYAKMIDIRKNADFSFFANKVITDCRSCLYYDRLYTLYQGIINIKDNLKSKQHVNILEIGVYKGGGSYFLGSVAEKHFNGRCTLYSVDTFEGHSGLDINNGKEGAHQPGLFNDTSYDAVKSYLSALPSVRVIKGRIQDVASQFDNVIFDFIHLDVDIYAPTIFSLDYFSKKIKPGGIIILDDYGYITSPGIRKAVTEFLDTNKNSWVRFELPTGQCLIIKVSN